MSGKGERTKGEKEGERGGKGMIGEMEREERRMVTESVSRLFYICLAISNRSVDGRLKYRRQVLNPRPMYEIIRLDTEDSLECTLTHCPRRSLGDRAGLMFERECCLDLARGAVCGARSLSLHRSALCVATLSKDCSSSRASPSGAACSKAHRCKWSGPE